MKGCFPFNLCMGKPAVTAVVPGLTPAPTGTASIPAGTSAEPNQAEVGAPGLASTGTSDSTPARTFVDPNQVDLGAPRVAVPLHIIQAARRAALSNLGQIQGPVHAVGVGFNDSSDISGSEVVYRRTATAENPLNLAGDLTDAHQSLPSSLVALPGVVDHDVQLASARTRHTTVNAASSQGSAVLDATSSSPA